FLLLTLSFALPRASAQLHRVLHQRETTPHTQPVAAAWYAVGRHATEGFPLSDANWDKYDTLIYSYLETTPSVHDLTLDGSNPLVFPRFVSEAHKHGVAAHVAFGGWTGGRWFSSNLATPENRTAFAKTVIDFAQQYGIDGVEFDWLYPNSRCFGCNTMSANDTQIFLSFLQELRKDPVGAKLTVSAATYVLPFNDATGNPSTDLTGFAEVLDYITIINYDAFGWWSATVGPNAPLNDACTPPDDRAGSAVSSVKTWNDAGIPFNKIILGVPAYGHGFPVSPSDAFFRGSKTELATFPKFNAPKLTIGDAWDDTGRVNVCGVYEGPRDYWEFWSLVDGGILTSKGDLAQRLYYCYDPCSQIPCVYNETSQLICRFIYRQGTLHQGDRCPRLCDVGSRGWLRQYPS
ncbi:glycoside hydrolase family 18 protein, partial [Paxillus rubicundulus Ve08.2h10]